jgi:hypothetical protein
MMSERRKADLCKQWLQYCRSIGWSVDDLGKLGDLFWKVKGWRTFKGWKAQDGA